MCFLGQEELTVCGLLEPFEKDTEIPVYIPVKVKVFHCNSSACNSLCLKKKRGIWVSSITPFDKRQMAQSKCKKYTHTTIKVQSKIPSSVQKAEQN